MITHKNFALLGTVAGLFVAQSAYAADLPVKAKAVEYVRVCSLYGAGFWYVPIVLQKSPTEGVSTC